MTATNTFGPNGLVSRNASGTATFNAYDLQGNTVHQYTPSEGGATVTNFAYDAYGNLVSGTAGGPYDGFGAQYGNYQDSAANGWYLMGHRWYGPGQLHFFSRDPIGFAGGRKRSAGSKYVDRVGPKCKLDKFRDGFGYFNYRHWPRS